MKKHYAIMALALAAATTASASVERQAVLAADAQLASAQMEQAVVASGMKMVNVNGPKKISQVSDLYGQYQAHWAYWLLNGADQWGGACNPVIEAGEGANEVIFSYFPYSDVTFVGTVDLDKGTITCAEQNTIYMSNYNEYMKFVGVKGIVEGEKINFEEGGAFVLNITDEGLEAPTDGFALRVTDGYFYCAAGFDIPQVKVYEFNAAEWNLLPEKCQYTDNWFVNFYNPDYWPQQPVECEVYQNKSNANMFAVVNPYMQGDWAQLNAASMDSSLAPGYVIFENLSCYDGEEYLSVLLPCVFNGLWGEYVEEGVMSDVAAYNNEGYLYFSAGWIADDIMDDCYASDITPSTYDPETRTAELRNLRFGITGAPMASYWFGEEVDPEAYIQVVLPDFGGVDGVEIDNSNAPVRYFNLQGVEVANPEQGQIVIKRQGTNSTKVIM